MSALEQFFGDRTPVGGVLLRPDAKPSFILGAQEYLLSGRITPYTTSYAAVIAEAPQLRVFGNNTKTKNVGTSTNYNILYSYIGTKYLALFSGYIYYSADLVTWTSAGVYPASALASSGSYIVSTNDTSNIAPKYTTDGITWTAVGGNFGTFLPCKGIAYGNGIWVALSSLNANAGEQGYIVNANPSGTWTAGASSNLGMARTLAIAYGNGVFVAVGESSSATAGKIATTASPAGGWTDRTAASGILFGASDSLGQVVFTGTHFIASPSIGAAVYRSADGITWTVVDTGAHTAGYSPFYATTFAGAAKVCTLATNGAGTVVAAMGSSGGIPRSLYLISTDHGLTWSAFQTYAGKAELGAGDYRYVSYANNKWLTNHSGLYTSLIDHGASFVEPDYVGYQYALAMGAYVRIK